MVTIRLSRGGTTKRPFYHIVATDHRNRRDGRYLERLGFFNPIASGQDATLRVDLGRVDYWVSCGAQMSTRVAELLHSHRAAQSAPVGAAAA
jgi:small subunit ribosomal protein S16